jgi:hypothetical protein
MADIFKKSEIHLSGRTETAGILLLTNKIGIIRRHKVNLDEKLKKTHEGLKERGEKYGYGSPPQYIIKPASIQYPQGWEYHFSCKVAPPKECALDIAVAVDEKEITVYTSSTSPKLFTGLDQVDDALEDVEEWLKSMKIKASG